MNRKQLRAEPRGGRSRAGTACLFLFPFDIFHNVGGLPVEAVFRGGAIRVYPPFSNDPDGRLPHVQVRLESIPRLIGTVAPHVDAPRLSNMWLQTNFGGGASRADALRIDLLGSVGAGSAAAYVDRFLELARMLSLQWWITRDRRFDEAYLRNTFVINQLGERLEGIAVQTMLSGQVGIERPLTRPVFEGIVEAAAREKRSPLSIMSACDAFYFFTIGDMRRFVVEAAIACETLLTEHAHHNATTLGVTPGVIKQEIDKSKFDRRLDAGCARVFGRSFATERPVATGWLEALWIGRNNAAHGKPLVVRHGGRTVQPQADDYLQMCKAVVELFDWMSKFGPYQPS